MVAAGEVFLWSCLYQQAPTSPTGGMFPEANWNWYDPDELPRLTLLRRSWDLAASEGTGDWTTGGKVARDADNHYYVLDVARFRKGPDAVLNDVKLHAAVDTPAVPILIEEERNGAGRTVITFYRRELEGWNVRASPAEGSKEDRARPYSTLQQRGVVHLPRDSQGNSPPWVKPFIKEHRKMMGDGRRGRHDDMIDVIAHAINDMIPIGNTEMLDPDLRLRSRDNVVIAAAEVDEPAEVLEGV
jgi:predicted phage terminase large subunit-like protein